MKIAGIQMDVVFAEPATNLRNIAASIERAADHGARLVVFPECALTGYCFSSLEEAKPFAEPLPGPSTMQLAEVCGRVQTHCVVGLLEAAGDSVFNACVLIGPEGIIGTYRKIHLPYLGVDRFVTPGDRPFQVHEVDGVRIGMNICYDCSFPESSRVMMLDGADLIVLPTNWPPGARCLADYIVNVRSMENCVYYMAVNRIGTERGFPFIGKSRICDPDGGILADAPHEEAAVLYAELDVARSRNKHLVRVPNEHEIDRLKDRRPEMYSRIVE